MTNNPGGNYSTLGPKFFQKKTKNGQKPHPEPSKKRHFQPRKTGFVLRPLNTKCHFEHFFEISSKTMLKNTPSQSSSSEGRNNFELRES